MIDVVEPKQEETKVITLEEATLALKDAVTNLRAQVVKQHPTPDNKATIEVEAKHYLDIANKTTALADAVKAAQEQLKIVDAKEKLGSLDLATKLAVLGLSKEELAAHLGLSATPITDTTPTVDTDTSIIIKYLTPTGEVETVKLESVYQRITTENFSSDVVKFWEWAQAQTEAKTITRPKKRGDGTTVVKVDKPYLKDVSDDELKELCKAYYAAA
ncbi:hypothetical protein ACK3YV_07425 [Aeromonas caviae]